MAHVDGLARVSFDVVLSLLRKVGVRAACCGSIICVRLEGRQVLSRRELAGADVDLKLTNLHTSSTS